MRSRTSVYGAAILLVLAAHPTLNATGDEVDTLERFTLSNAIAVDALVRTGIYGGTGAVVLLRAPDGYAVGAFFRTGKASFASPGLVASKPYDDYFVIWDKGYANVLALEVDRENAEYGSVPMALGVNGKYGAVATKLLVSRGTDPSAAPHADIVRQAISRLTPRFLATVRTLYVVSQSHQVKDVPATLGSLKSFMDVPESVTIASREKLTEEEGDGILAFLRAFPIPTRDQTGVVAE